MLRRYAKPHSSPTPVRRDAINRVYADRVYADRIYADRIYADRISTVGASPETPYSERKHLTGLMVAARTVW
ncbi:hypothetical protein AB9P05_10540 [Roseivirga sp. BDSF3-8]|uniref:hypothetical protein n=1 Tax=Roseivirga sp. BDSF3-8 TaxID=3241598 RepID=UPI00353273ED